MEIYNQNEKNHAVTLICEGYNVDYVAELYEVTTRTIREWVRLSRRPITVESSKEVIKLIEKGFQHRKIVQKLLLFPKDVDKIRATFILFRYIQGLSIHEIEEKYSTNHRKINEILDNFGILRIGQKECFTLISRINNSKCIKITNFLLEIIIGNLLGDGSLLFSSRKNKKKIKNFFNNTFNIQLYIQSISFFEEIRFQSFNLHMDFQKLVKDYNNNSYIIINSSSTCLRMGKSIIELEFLEHCLTNLYEKNNYSVNLSIKFTKHYNMENYTGTYKISVLFQTRSSVQLTKKYFEWYPDETKIIPKFIEITSNTLLIWYLDDGSYSKIPRKKNPKSFRHFLGISTESFSKLENEFLVKKIFTLTKIQFSIIKSKKGLWRIGISSQNEIKSFINFLETNSNQILFDAANKSFPWKFDTEHNKTWYLTKLREQNNPLIKLFDLRVPESEIKLNKTQELINNLLIKAESKLRIIL